MAHDYEEKTRQFQNELIKVLSDISKQLERLKDRDNELHFLDRLDSIVHELKRMNDREDRR